MRKRLICIALALSVLTALPALATDTVTDEGTQENEYHWDVEQWLQSRQEAADKAGITLQQFDTLVDLGFIPEEIGEMSRARVFELITRDLDAEGKIRYYRAQEGTGIHTVQDGDLYGKIAVNYYGSYGAWRLLYEINNYRPLTAGTELILPEILGSYTLLPTPVAGEGETLYTVKAGDTLGGIAKTVYGDVMKYKAIFERNADRLKNADTIYEGQTIVLPTK